MLKKPGSQRHRRLPASQKSYTASSSCASCRGRNAILDDVEQGLLDDGHDKVAIFAKQCALGKMVQAAMERTANREPQLLETKASAHRVEEFGFGHGLSFTGSSRQINSESQGGGLLDGTWRTVRLGNRGHDLIAWIGHQSSLLQKTSAEREQIYVSKAAVVLHLDPQEANTVSGHPGN